MSARGGKELPFGEKCAIMAADSQASEVSHEKETIVPRLRARADDLSAPRRTGAGGRRHARCGGSRVPRSCDRHGAGYAAEDAATQEQAAALLVRLLGAEKTAKADRRSCGWAGIPSWARSAVNYCAFHDLIDWSEYHAGGALDAELWCAMLLRALGYGSELGSSTARTALRIGLISRPLEGTLTRGDLFETALAALTYPAKDGGTLLDGLLAKGLCTAAAVEALGLRRETLTAREAADRHLSAILCLDLFADEEAIEADEPTANASAFLISPDGLAVTNYHSIDGAISGRATLITGEACAIERVIYYDADIDLAVIRIARTTAEGETVPRFHAIALAGAKEVRMGDTVYALGNPLGLGLAMSRGIVSATAHKADLSTLPCIVSDATISRGSSGGALLNEYGRAVAVTTGAYVYGNNMYLCVPLDPVLEADLTGEGMTLQEVLDAVTAAREAAAAAAEAGESR